MNFTGSPIIRVTTNTNTVTPKMTTTPCTRRRAMYRPMLPLPLLVLRRVRSVSR